MRHRRQDDDTGVSEMKAFGEELIATGARYIEAGKRWFETRRDEATERRETQPGGSERQRPMREPERYRPGPDDDGHGRSAWLGGRPSRPDLQDPDAGQGTRHDHAFWDEPPQARNAGHGAGPGRSGHRWQPSGRDRDRGTYGSSDPLRDSDDHLSDWGHRAHAGQGRGGLHSGHDDDREAAQGGRRHVPGGWRGVGPKGYVRSDTRIAEDVSEHLMHDDAIDAREISVQVRDGVVTLEGQVSRRAIKHRVEDVVERCAGVRDIENRLRVQTADAWRSQDTGRPQSGQAGSPGSTAHGEGSEDAAGSASGSGIADIGPGGATSLSSQDDPTVKGA